MAENERNTDDRTEPATAYRREEFRKQGTVAVSKELISAASLMISGLLFSWFGTNVLKEFSNLSEKFFKGPVEVMTTQRLVELAASALVSLAWMVLPLTGVILLVGVLASVAQVGFYPTFEPLTPNWSRVNPITGFQRLFSGASGVEAVKTLVKMVIGTFVLWYFAKNELPTVALYLSKNVPEIAAMIPKTINHFYFVLIGGFLGIAVLDFAFQKYQLEKQMRMTKQEVKEEFKMREGDPLMKSRIRGIQRRLASRRMMEAIPKADVVVTNPTHFAVALKYDPKEMPAPQVIAKGADHLALKIKELARKYSVPLVENKPLARTLYRDIDVNHYVPRELYKAVAEVLAYVYRLKNLSRQAV